MRGHDITEQPSRIRRAGLGGRRLPSGPRPARPRVVPVGVRPVQPARPATPPGARRSAALTLLGSRLLGSGLLGPVLRTEQRVLARRAPVARPTFRTPRRTHSALVVAALTVATAAAVVLLGLLADSVATARAGAPAMATAGASGMVTAGAVTADPYTASAGAVSSGLVVVDTETTVWDVAERVAPAASGPEVAALAERLVTANGLSTVRVQPGQVLRVTAG